MYWVTFLVGGFIVASVPWVASQFNNRIAGYLILIPVMFLVSISVQYLASGSKAAIETTQGALWGLPSLLVLGAVLIIALRNNLNLPMTIALGLIAWSISLIAINILVSNYLQ